MQIDRNCGMGYPYQPGMMPVMPMAPMPPFTGEANSIEQRLSNIEKRLSILENNLNNQNLSSNMLNNYQMI